MHHAIELLESRIAPATLLTGGKGFFFTDGDGDTVTVKNNKAVFDFNIHTLFTQSGTGEVLRSLNLDATFEAANLTVTVKKGPAGDGRTDVGLLFAQTINLGNVKIAGDLEQIQVGTGGLVTPAIKSLSVLSWGEAQFYGGTQLSKINGNFTSIAVKGDFLRENLEVTGNGNAVAIGGNIQGSGDLSSGVVKLAGIVKTVTVKGSVQGDALFSGSLSVNTANTVKIGGNLVGGNQGLNGEVAVTNAKSVTIGGTLIGTARVALVGDVKTLTVGGIDGGNIYAPNNVTIGSVTIKGDVIKPTPDANSRPTIEAGNIGTLKILGSIRAQLTTAGDAQVLAVHGTVKSLSVKGDIDGGTGGKLVLSVDGLGGISSVKILGGMTVGGNVKNTFFNLGNNGALTSLGQIGKISVGKDWTSSTLSAGTTLGKNPPTLAAPYNVVKGPTGISIESFAIKGSLKLDGGGILSAIGADDLKTLTIKGKKAALTPGMDETLIITDGMITDLMIIYKVA